MGVDMAVTRPDIRPKVPKLTRLRVKWRHRPQSMCCVRINKEALMAS